MKELDKRIDIIEETARNLGLDFFPTYFELCSPQVIHAFVSYGVPTRFRHWSFGKSFFKLQFNYDLRIERIYELVVNSNPCYAYIMENNSLLLQSLVVAHVLAHSDFFKNNIFFAASDRQILNTMAIHQERIKLYEEKYGFDKVEKTLDAVFALRNNILPSIQGDLLTFLCVHSKALEDWQRDIIAIFKKELEYFLPLRDTKIINEGWATYWHSKIMKKLPLSTGEQIEFARLQGILLQNSKFALNPYVIGFKMFTHIESTYGCHEVFKVRSNERDISLFRNYLDEDLAKKLSLYMYGRRGDSWTIIETQWQKVRDGIVDSLINGGFPIIKALDNNYQKTGGLYLFHCRDKKDLDLYYLENTLKHIHFLWGEKVYLETVVKKEKKVFSYKGD
ncbi:MAG: SpoVR family protein [Bacillota bacterium]